jgi:hypothetical protein
LESAIWAGAGELPSVGIVVSKVVNPKVLKLLLEITGHEASWRKDAMTEEVERSCQALIGSEFLRGSREV